MLNKLLNLFGFHVVIVRVNEANGIYWCADYWAKFVDDDSSDHRTFTEVANLFNTKGK